MLLKTTPFLLLALLFCVFSYAQTEDKTLLLRSPSISQDHIVFAYASDIWLADKDGNYPRRLTVDEGVEENPVLSPDGKWVAFSANYDGNLDVFVLPIEGGTPQRLTFHPALDRVRGWHGNKVIFASYRASFSQRFSQLFEIDLDGGLPKALPMPEAHQGAISPDGKYTAYIKNPDPTESTGTYRPFKGYRGGNTPKVWIFDNATYEIEEIPHANAINTYPVWLDEQLYFLSDRDGITNIYTYNQEDQSVRKISSHRNFDVKTLHSNGKELIYEQGGQIVLFDPVNGQSKEIHIFVKPDLPTRRVRYEDVEDNISNFAVSPTGKRALFEARGDILTAPAEKGDVRNLTTSPGVFERYPAWSPDGKWIAYFSDASGEYALHIIDQKGTEKPTIISLEDPTFYYTPVWSPDSKMLVFSDKNFQLYLLDIASKTIKKIDQGLFSTPNVQFNPSWSPDSKWVAYARQLENQLKAIFLYEVATGKTHQVTDGMSQVDFPAFGRGGKHLYFAASTNYGLNVSWLDMSNYEREVRSSLYAIVLSDEAPSPFAPESDEENIGNEDEEGGENEMSGEQDESGEGGEDGEGGEGGEGKEEEVEPVDIDLEGIEDRTIALPTPARVYSGLNGGVKDKLFYLESVDNQPGFTLHVYDLKKRESSVFMAGIFGYEISADGKKLIYAAPDNTYGIVNTMGKHKPGDGKVNLSDVQIKVDPVKEWGQIYNEVWRIERDFFYVENLHGVDWAATKRKYQKFLPYVGHREDLNYLLSEMMGELVIGHNYVGGGDFPEIDEVNTGLLGADYALDNGFYQIERIFSGLNWNPTFRAPLTEPGVDVNEGDYLLEVNGEALTAQDNIYELFRNTVDKQTILTLNDRPTLDGARQVTVVPIGSEANLRNMAWVEGNRQKVDELTNGRVAYVYLPNTGQGGYTFFNRYYFSQLDKEAIIIDERFNGGGSAADYIIDLLDRELMNYWGTRSGRPSTTPGAAIFGPKVMIINEYAASGGDLLPYLFREKDMGELIGKRTLGILIGIYSYPQLIDGGFATAPRLGIFDKEGNWIIENEGVHPDIEVEMTPKAVIEGRDPQLEKAVEVILKKLDKTEDTKMKKPKGPKRARK